MNIYLIYKYMHNIHTINLYKNKNNSNNKKHYYYILNNLFLHNDLINQDINLLSSQIDLAENSRGWVLQALNSYQIGFSKGVREAVDFDLI